MGTIAGKRVLVTGGAGFLGREVVRALRLSAGGDPRAAEFRVRSARPRAVQRLLARLAPTSSCIWPPCRRNRRQSGQSGPLFLRKRHHGHPVMEEARLATVDKFVVLGTICAYPKFTPVPFREERPVERLPRGNQRPLWAGEKNAASSRPRPIASNMG